MNTTIHSVEEMRDFGVLMLQTFHESGERVGYKKAIVVGLSGDLGSGKTTFSQQIAEMLDVGDRVTSPTFVIEKIYETDDIGKFEKLVHIDAYRIERAEEMDALRFNELLNTPNTLVLIEWPEKLEGLLPEDVIKIHFEFVDEKTRQVSY